jgi:hypothetical protein
VLAAKAPALCEALDGAAGQGLPYLILDGTLISSDRCACQKTSKKGKQIDKWYSDKARVPLWCRTSCPAVPRPDRRPRARPPQRPALPGQTADPRRFRVCRRRRGHTRPGEETRPAARRSSCCAIVSRGWRETRIRPHRPPNPRSRRKPGASRKPNGWQKPSVTSRWWTSMRLHT